MNNIGIAPSPVMHRQSLFSKSIKMNKSVYDPRNLESFGKYGYLVLFQFCFQWLIEFYSSP